MSHARTQVRDAIATALRTISGMSSNVYEARVNPLPESALPAYLVYTTDEEISTETINPPRTQIRILSVMVDVVVQVNDDYDEDLDDHQELIEKLIGGSTFLATMNTAKWQNCVLVSANKAMSGEPGTTTAALRMEYQVQYATFENAPQTLI